MSNFEQSLCSMTASEQLAQLKQLFINLMSHYEQTRTAEIYQDLLQSLERSEKKFEITKQFTMARDMCLKMTPGLEQDRFFVQLLHLEKITTENT